jgi:hypothetical protein
MALRGRPPKKLTKRQQLCMKLEKLSKEYMYLRDGLKCVVCNKGQHLQWGHLFSRRVYATRYDPDNYYVQCSSCNLRHTFDTVPYYTWFIDNFGREKFDDLYHRWKSGAKQSTQDLEDKVVYLESLINEHKDRQENSEVF